MKFFLSLNIFIFSVSFAQSTAETGPYELMSALVDVKPQTLNSEYALENVFSHGDSLPSGTRLIVDKHYKSAPDGMYRVYAVPENSEFGVNANIDVFKANTNMQSTYESFESRINDDCEASEENPYLCQPYFYIKKSELGAAPPLEREVIQTAIELNEIVDSSVTTPVEECHDCLTARISSRNVSIDNNQELATRPQIRPATPSTNNSDTDCSIRLSGQMVNCNSPGKENKSWLEVQKMVCLYSHGSRDFCSDIQQDFARIEVIADVMGLDQRQLACMTLIESGYRLNARSSAGAGGIAQFMPATARSSANRIRTTYLNEWNQFQQRVGGTPFSASSVTADAIRGGHSSYGLFAMATYLRDSLTTHGGRNMEEQWRRHISSGGDPNHLFHAQITAYNWRPANFDNVSDAVIRGEYIPKDYSGFPRETRNYMVDLDNCMYNDSDPWDHRSQNTPRERINSCNINNNQPVCPSGNSGSNAPSS